VCLMLPDTLFILSLSLTVDGRVLSVVPGSVVVNVQSTPVTSQTIVSQVNAGNFSLNVTVGG
jgi:hypothetical protein